MATPKTPDDRIAALSAAFEKAFADKALTEQMEKAGESIVLLKRPEIEKMVAQQSEVIDKYKDLLT